MRFCTCKTLISPYMYSLYSDISVLRKPVYKMCPKQEGRTYFQNHLLQTTKLRSFCNISRAWNFKYEISKNLHTVFTGDKHSTYRLCCRNSTTSLVQNARPPQRSVPSWAVKLQISQSTDKRRKEEKQAPEFIMQLLDRETYVQHCIFTVTAAQTKQKVTQFRNTWA